MDIEGRVSNIYVMKRPGAEYFLEQMAKYFEVCIFTASLSKVSQHPGELFLLTLSFFIAVCGPVDEHDGPERPHDGPLVP